MDKKEWKKSKAAREECEIDTCLFSITNPVIQAASEWAHQKKREPDDRIVPKAIA